MEQTKTYQYQPVLRVNGGYEGEPQGVLPSNPPRTTTSQLSGDATYQYYFRDSNAPAGSSTADMNANSSRVVITITDHWTASISSANVLTITINTTVDKMVRDDTKGNPNWGGTYGREMQVKREEGGAVLWSIANDPINYNHTILNSAVDLGTFTYSIQPGGTSQFRASTFIKSHTPGFPDQAPYTDYIWAGIAFYNNLPKDYRPGMIWNGTAWMSHNRSKGAFNIRNSNGDWQECRTENAGSVGNPPAIYYDNAMRNMRLIGRQ